MCDNSKIAVSSNCIDSSKHTIYNYYINKWKRKLSSVRRYVMTRFERYDDFYLDGKSFKILSGAIHFRVGFLQDRVFAHNLEGLLPYYSRRCCLEFILIFRGGWVCLKGLIWERFSQTAQDLGSSDRLSVTFIWEFLVAYQLGFWPWWGFVHRDPAILRASLSLWPAHWLVYICWIQAISHDAGLKHMVLMEKTKAYRWLDSWWKSVA